MTPIERAATRLREKLAAETTAAIERKAKLLTKHADQLAALAKSDGEKRAAIVAPYSVEVRNMAAEVSDA